MNAAEVKRIYVAGHQGMVGSALTRQIRANPAIELITRDRQQLDLCNQSDVNQFFAEEKPDCVIFAAARVGGIHANRTYPAEFIYDNLIMACNAAAAIEGVLLGVKAGLDPRIIHEVVSVSTGGSRIFDNMVGRMLDTPSAPKPGTVAAQGLHTVSKDVRLAMALAQSNGVPVPMGAAAAQIWLAAEARGLSRHEIWSLAEVLEELTGVRVALR